MTVNKPVAFAVLVLAMIASGSYVAYDWRLLYRYFTHSGDPMTVGVAWYQPKETITGTLSPDLPVIPPDQRTISQDALNTVAAFAEGQKASALIVVRNGKIEFEKYWNGNDRETWFNPQSMSKSVLGLLVGSAIADGFIASIDDPVGKYITEWNGDPRGAITIRQALWMEAGLEQMTSNYETNFFSRGVRYNFGSDFVGLMLKLRQIEPPGTKFEYNNEVNNILGLIIERASGRRYADYLSEKIWRPLGLHDAAMYLDRPGGTVMKSCCIFSRPIDWAKIGLLILNRGEWQNNRLLDASWIDAMTAPSPLTKYYGYQIWLASGFALDEVKSAPKGMIRKIQASELYADTKMVMMLGYGNQRVWISGPNNLVIVYGTDRWAPKWDDAKIPNTIIRGIKSD